jgi:hypothetical protein
VLSRAQLRRLVRARERTKQLAVKSDDLHSLLGLRASKSMRQAEMFARGPGIKEQFDGWVVVKRKVKADADEATFDLARSRAFDRAVEVLAGLNLALLASHPNRRAVGFPEHAVLSGQTITALHSDGWAPRWFTGGTEQSKRAFRVSLGASHALRFRALLKGDTRPMDPLARFLETNDTLYGLPIGRTIRLSSCRIFDALHARSSGESLVGAITAIELLLLSDQGKDSYDVLQKRLGALVGEHWARFYHSARVVDGRHRYIHQAEKPPADLAIAAIGLAACALHAVAELASLGTSKSDLLRRLDYVAFGRAAASALPAEWLAPVLLPTRGKLLLMTLPSVLAMHGVNLSPPMSAGELELEATRVLKRLAAPTEAGDAARTAR